MEKIKHDGIITKRKITENKKDQGLEKISIIEIPYKILKEYFAAQNEEEYLESIQNWNQYKEDERSELHGD